MVLAYPPAAAVMAVRLYGIDWSGAKRAGNKIWVATLDPDRGVVTDVGRPWRSRTNPDVTIAVAEWLNQLEGGWVGLDSPFGLASCDRDTLTGINTSDPFRWSRALVQRHPTRESFVSAAKGAGLIGRHRRATDKNARSPFAPLLNQLIYQTYAALRLISHLDRSRVRVLPWEHALARPVTLMETCPAVLLERLGLSNRGYKLKPGSEEVRQFLWSSVLSEHQLKVDETIHDAVIRDREGDALDAILCAIAASRSITTDHTRIAEQPGAVEEGWIYA